MRYEIPGHAVTLPMRSSEPTLLPARLRRYIVQEHRSTPLLALRTFTGLLTERNERLFFCSS